VRIYNGTIIIGLTVERDSDCSNDGTRLSQLKMPDVDAQTGVKV